MSDQSKKYALFAAEVYHEMGGWSDLKAICSTVDECKTEFENWAGSTDHQSDDCWGQVVNLESCEIKKQFSSSMTLTPKGLKEWGMTEHGPGD